MVNPQQIRAISEYLNSQGAGKQALSPTVLEAAKGMATQSLPMPTADDLRRYQMEVASDPNPNRWSWGTQEVPKESGRPIGRKKTIGLSYDPDIELNGIYKSNYPAVEHPEDYYQAPNYQTIYTPGFQNYMDGWVDWIDNWEDNWNQVYTPQ